MTNNRMVFYADRETFERFEETIKAGWRFTDPKIQQTHILVPMQLPTEMWPVLVMDVSE